MALFVPDPSAKPEDHPRIIHPLLQPPWGAELCPRSCAGGSSGPGLSAREVPGRWGWHSFPAVFILPGKLEANWEQKGCPGDKDRGREREGGSHQGR